MGPEAAHIAAAIAKSQEVNRSPGSTQRVSDAEQAQLASESVSAHSVLKTDAADNVELARRKHERERRRRELERHPDRPGQDEDAGPDEGPAFDMVA